jgi:hypothetical protein
MGLNEWIIKKLYPLIWVKEFSLFIHGMKESLIFSTGQINKFKKTYSMKEDTGKQTRRLLGASTCLKIWFEKMLYYQTREIREC